MIRRGKVLIVYFRQDDRIYRINKIVLLILKILSNKPVRTITTTLFTAVTTPQEIPSSEDHQSVFEVIVLTLFKHLSLVIRFHHL